ncbi:MAG TPA: UDP-4-amino-4,6-dideoxy-N-acetyl-beta-L-altrosamine N-acetyltransferase [Candidatus Mucispirillum faecigallinarum]|uniref:UDP-4-amino-4, 6-dideoxy-N-acetyl-beta-L-altrosamine N-acetyltransferase n=1 Tax=Candidatus Mucispirillum faecigallinarum TaxID=2838699 RepID=A0A9D2GSZ1_9BACT|nr:UDP-4-amino-4,6-dideoxy-N-acetyl-beta-L-altrosamine N-acetyltransferase [Candidatus Mucispirillum faecigallinarum]
MNILLLGEKCSLINDTLNLKGHNTFLFTDKIVAENVLNYDFIISFGYRHIISKDIIDLFPDKIINMHISFLPYNKGADPNLWSYLENSPKGVTIHKIDKGINTGDILLQKEVQDNIETDTLKTSFNRLIDEIVILFNDNADDILNGRFQGQKQLGNGSMHYLRNKEKYLYVLNNGYDTLVKDLITESSNNKTNNDIYLTLSDNNMNVSLRNFIYCNTGLVNEILLWRNHETIRLNSKNNHIINIEEHYKFIQFLKHDKKQMYFVVLQNNIYLGVISFADINTESAYIGYYKNPFTNMHGIGRLLIKSAKNYAYNTLGLKEIYMEVFNNNDISKHCVLQEGFEEISKQNNLIIYKLRLK